MFLLRLVERDDRPDALYLVNESVKRISGFVAGNLLVSLVAFVASFAAFRLMGLDYALALAVWVAFTDLIPVLGAALGSVLVLVVAATQNTGLVIGSLVFLVLYQQFENYIVVPRVMKQTVDLSPAVVIVAFLAGGSLAGIIGALLALPITAVLKLVVMELIVEPRMRRVRAGTGSGPTPSTRRNRSRRV